VRRADLAVAIQDAEGAELLSKTDKPVVTVSFYDRSLETDARPLIALEYRSPDKVTFGALASDNPFNVAGLDALLEALEKVIGDTFAPIEVVVGGRVGERIKKRAGVKILGWVESEATFYADVDFAIAPVFDGTGFKVKMADALALRMPTLLSGHAAEGAVIDSSMVCQTPADMAQLMAEIALKRPPLTDALTHIRRARSDLRTRVGEGEANLLAVIADGTRPVVIDLSSVALVGDRLALYSWFSSVRIFSERFPVILLLSVEVLRVVGKYLPLGVKAMTPDLLRVERKWSRLVVIDVFGKTDPALLGLTGDDLVLFDQRWGKEVSGASGVFGPMPMFNNNASWEPAVLALRRAEKTDDAEPFRFPGSSTRIIFTDTPTGVPPLCLDGKTTSVFVPVSDWTVFQSAIFALLDGAVKEVIWSAEPRGVAHRAACQACALRGIAYHGWLDQAALGRGALPKSYLPELERLCGQVVDEFKATVAQIEIMAIST